MNRTGHPATAGLWTIVLAAGGSSRLGRPKQLERYRNRPLMLHAVQQGKAICDDRVLVVLGANRIRLLAALRRSGLALTAAVNPRWQGGMASSLARGIDLLPGSARAALILLTDQPRVTPADLGRLVSRWRRRPTTAVAAEYAGRVGVPAILPRRLFRELRQLEGDAGARRLLAGLPQIDRIPLPNAAFDVDTEADASKLHQPAQSVTRAGQPAPISQPVVSAGAPVAQLTQPETPER